MFAFMFPGQGAQAVGMANSVLAAFPAARAVMAEVDEALGDSLGISLSTLIADGPEDVLRLTSNAQPALMATSLALVRALETEFGFQTRQAAFMAGHSLGEYSALAAARALALGDCARLLHLRGSAMQAASPPGEGAMASLVGPKVDIAFAEAAAEAGNAIAPCVVANDNNVGNIVISGAKAGVGAAIAWAQAQGARAIPLNVSAPFHSPLMVPAERPMQAALAGVALQAPCVPVYANVTAAPVSDPAMIRELLVRQIAGRVRWRETVLAMAAAGIDAFVEIGPGKTLSGMVKRIAPEARTFNIAEAADLPAFAEAFLTR